MNEASGFRFGEAISVGACNARVLIRLGGRRPACDVECVGACYASDDYFVVGISKHVCVCRMYMYVVSHI